MDRQTKHGEVAARNPRCLRRLSIAPIRTELADLDVDVAYAVPGGEHIPLAG